VVNVSAVRWLDGSCLFLFKAGPMWVKQLDRGVAEQRTYAAAMPAALLAAIQVELLARYDAAHPDAPPESPRARPSCWSTDSH
jgi:hypothetical protein